MISVKTSVFSDDTIKVINRSVNNVKILYIFGGHTMTTVFSEMNEKRISLVLNANGGLELICDTNSVPSDELVTRIKKLKPQLIEGLANATKFGDLLKTIKDSTDGFVGKRIHLKATVRQVHGNLLQVDSGSVIMHILVPLQYKDVFKPYMEIECTGVITKGSHSYMQIKADDYISVNDEVAF